MNCIIVKVAYFLSYYHLFWMIFPLMWTFGNQISYIISSLQKKKKNWYKNCRCGHDFFRYNFFQIAHFQKSFFFFFFYFKDNHIQCILSYNKSRGAIRLKECWHFKVRILKSGHNINLNLHLFKLTSHNTPIQTPL